jgi:hypothetical protein
MELQERAQNIKQPRLPPTPGSGTYETKIRGMAEE